MKNELTIVEAQGLEVVKAQRELLKEFIRSQLVLDTDFGTIPGTRKPTLFKPGAEKLAKLFNLGARIADKERTLEESFAYFSYTIEVIHLPTDKVVAQCEGSANSNEDKYRNVPLADNLNTLQKMAQKRAYVGAVIQAVGASDFYTYDDAETTGDQPSGKVPHKYKAIDSRKTYRTEPGGPVMELEEGVELPYRIPFGKYRAKGLAEVSPGNLFHYCEYLVEDSRKEGVTREQMAPAVQDFLSRAEDYLIQVGYVPPAEDEIVEIPDQNCTVCDTKMVPGKNGGMTCKPCTLRRKRTDNSRPLDNGPFRLKTRR